MRCLALTPELRGVKRRWATGVPIRMSGINHRDREYLLMDLAHGDDVVMNAVARRVSIRRFAEGKRLTPVAQSHLYAKDGNQAAAQGPRSSFGSRNEGDGTTSTQEGSSPSTDPLSTSWSWRVSTQRPATP